MFRCVVSEGLVHGGQTPRQEQHGRGELGRKAPHRSQETLGKAQEEGVGPDTASKTTSPGSPRDIQKCTLLISLESLKSVH